MLIAAVAVSVGAVPLPFGALVKSVVQWEEPVVLLMQAARMSARALIFVVGTVPLPAAVVACAFPLAWPPMLSEFANALARLTRASGVPELAMYVASVAKPASA